MKYIKDEGKVRRCTSNIAKMNIFEYLYSRIEDEFSYRDCEMFYKTFGLKGFDITKNKDIAKLYNVSEGLSCQKVSKIIKWIRKDNDLCEQLSLLLAK